MKALLLRFIRFLRRILFVVIIPYLMVLGIAIYMLKGYEGEYYPYSYHRVAEQAQGGFTVLQENIDSGIKKSAGNGTLVLCYTNRLPHDADIHIDTLKESGQYAVGLDTLKFLKTTIMSVLPLDKQEYVVLSIDSMAVRAKVYSASLGLLADCVLESATHSYSDVQMVVSSPNNVYIRLERTLYQLHKLGEQSWRSQLVEQNVVAIPTSSELLMPCLPFLTKVGQYYWLNILEQNSAISVMPPSRLNADTTPTIVPLHHGQFGMIVPTNLRTRALLYQENKLKADTMLTESPSAVWWGSTDEKTLLHHIVITARGARLATEIMTPQRGGISGNSSSMSLGMLAYPLGFMQSPNGVVVRFINGWTEIDKSGSGVNSIDMTTSFSGDHDISSLVNRTGRRIFGDCYIDIETRNGIEYAVLYQRTFHRWYWLKNIVSKMGYWILGSIMLGVFVVVVQKLRQYRRISYAIIKTPSAPITLVIDTNRRVTFESAKARELLVKSDVIALQGRKLSSLNLDQTGKKIAAMIEQCFRENQNVTDDIEHIELSADKQEEVLRVYDCTVSPITSFGNHLRGVLLIGRDVTEEREKKEVEISWSIAHDMQTPLATITMATERLQRIIASETVNVTQLRDAMKIISVQARNLSERVKDWKILAGKQVDVPTETDIQILCESIMDDLGPSYYDGSIRFVVDVTPNLVVLCYPHNINSALRNMISNSLRAIAQTQKQEIARHTLCLKVYKESTYPYCLVFELGDTGEGIKKETLNKLNRGAIVTENQRKGGTGTGTRIVRECIRKHNARDAKKMRLPALKYESPSMIQNVRLREGVEGEVPVSTKVTLRLLPIYKRVAQRQNQQSTPEYIPVESGNSE